MEEISTKMCPVCNSEVADENQACSQCEGSYTEPDVNNVIESEANDRIESDTNGIAIKKKSKKPFFIIGILLCTVAIGLLIAGITRFTCDEYEFYSAYYEVCMDEYRENRQTANSYSGLFKEAYLSIAAQYKELADDCLEELNQYKTAGTLCFVGSGVTLAAGCVLFVIGKKKSSAPIE